MYPVYLTTQSEKDRFDDLMEKIDKNELVLSYSSFSRFMKSPSHFVMYKCQDRKEDTAAITEGHVLHCLCLEPHTFEERYVVMKCKKPSSANQVAFAHAINEGMSAEDAYKANYSCSKKSDDKIVSESNALLSSLSEYIAFISSIKGREVISSDLYNRCETMANVVRNNKASKYYVTNILSSEKSVQWEYKGFKFRGFIDAVGMNPFQEECDGAFILDMKKFVDASPRRAINEVKYGGWGLQGFFYLSSLGDYDIPYYIVAVDTNYQTSTIRISQSTLWYWKREVDFYLKKFNECIMNWDWEASYDYYNNYETGIFTA